MLLDVARVEPNGLNGLCCSSREVKFPLLILMWGGPWEDDWLWSHSVFFRLALVEARPVAGSLLPSL